MYSIQQENELIHMAQHGNKTACEQLLQAYTGLLHKMAHRYQHTPSGRELSEDAPGILALAFMESVHAFDSSRGVHFAAFLQSRLQGALYKALRKTCTCNLHTAHPAASGTDAPWYNLVESPAPTPERIITARDELSRLSRQLSTADKQLLSLLYYHELPQNTIARLLHLSPQTVSKRKQKLLAQLSQKCV
jgi:RNA polymerase sigma factor (sigma-70 family)